MNRDSVSSQNNVEMLSDNFVIKIEQGDGTIRAFSSEDVIVQCKLSNDRETFANSVLEILSNAPIVNLHHYDIARTIATVILFATSAQLQQFICRAKLSPKCFTDHLAIRVLLKIIDICILRDTKKGGGTLQKNNAEGDVTEVCDEEVVANRHAVKDSFVRFMAPYFLEEFVTYIWNPHCNGLILKLLSLCSEQPEQPAAYSFVNTLAMKLIKLKRLTDLVYNDVSSSFLVKLLPIVKAVNEELCDKIILKMIDDSFVIGVDVMKNLCMPMEGVLWSSFQGNAALPIVFRNSAACRVLESVLCYASAVCFEEIYCCCLKTNLLQLAISEVAWRCVAVYLRRCSTLTQFEEAYEQLGEKLEYIMMSGNTQVLVDLAGACLRLDSKQGCFQEHMMQALECLAPHWGHMFVPLVLRLVPLEEMLKREQMSPHEHGVQLLSTMLGFRRTAVIVGSFLELGLQELKYVLCHQLGPDILTKVLSSKHVQQTNKDSFFRMIMDSVVELSCSQHGSQSLFAMWPAACLSQRVAIMEKLLTSEAAVSDNPHAARMASTFNLAAFKDCPEGWERAQTWD